MCQFRLLFLLVLQLSSKSLCLYFYVLMSEIALMKARQVQTLCRFICECSSYEGTWSLLLQSDGLLLLLLLSFILWCDSSTRTQDAPSLMLIDTRIFRQTTLSRNPLHEGSALGRDLYLTTRNTHNRQPSMTPAGFEPATPAIQRLQTLALDRAASETG